METINRSLEGRLRQRACSRGYYITKSRQQPHLNNQGDYMLVEAYRNTVVLGARYDATLGDIEDFLSDQEPQRLPRWR